MVCPWALAALSTLCSSSRLKHNILMHPFQHAGGRRSPGRVFVLCHARLFSHLQPDSRNHRYPISKCWLQIRSGGRNHTIFLAAHGYFGRLIFSIRQLQQFPLACTFFLAAWPVVCIWFVALGISTMAFNLNGFNFNHSILDSQGRIPAQLGRCTKPGQSGI